MFESDGIRFDEEEREEAGRGNYGHGLIRELEGLNKQLDGRGHLNPLEAIDCQELLEPRETSEVREGKG